MADVKNEGGFAAFSKRHESDKDNDKAKKEVPRGEENIQEDEEE